MNTMIKNESVQYLNKIGNEYNVDVSDFNQHNDEQKYEIAGVIKSGIKNLSPFKDKRLNPAQIWEIKQAILQKMDISDFTHKMPADKMYLLRVGQEYNVDVSKFLQGYNERQQGEIALFVERGIDTQFITPDIDSETLNTMRHDILAERTKTEELRDFIDENITSTNILEQQNIDENNKKAEYNLEL